MDYNIQLNNGQILRGFIKSPGSDMRGVIILVHGLGEHTGRYSGWSDLFIKENFAFTGVDLPGHGLSDGKKGHIKNYSVTDEMISILLQECRKTFPGIPLFLYGHSLGGGIVLDYILRKKPGIKGAIVTSPWLRLSFEPDPSKVRLAGILRNILPSLIQRSGLRTEHLSHNEENIREYNSDPLVHDRISVSLFYSAMEAGKNSLKNASSLGLPLLLMHGNDDQICSAEASSDFAGKTKSADLKIWEGGYHELHNEDFNNEVFRYITGWLTGVLN